MGNIDGNGKVLWKSKGRRSRSCGLGLGLGEGLRTCQLPSGLGLGDALQLPKEDLAGALRVFRTPEASTVRRLCAAEPLRTIAAILPGSKWSWLLLRTVLQNALSEVTKIYAPLKLRVFVDDITALVKGRNKEVAETAKKVMKNLKEEVEKKGVKLSVTENGKEGKSKMIASCGSIQ